MWLPCSGNTFSEVSLLCKFKRNLRTQGVSYFITSISPSLSKRQRNLFLHPSLYCSVMLFFPFLAAWPQRRGVGSASEEADVVSKGRSWRNWGKWAYREMRWELRRKGLSVIWMGIICQKRRWNRRRSMPHIRRKEEIMLESKKTWRRLKEGRKTDLCHKSVALWKPCWLFLAL